MSNARNPIDFEMKINELLSQGEFIMDYEKEIERLKNDLRLALEIGVDQQRQLNRSLTFENKRLKEKITKLETELDKVRQDDLMSKIGME